MTEISAYHAHVYFDERTAEAATRLCEAVRDRFGAEMGRVHRKPVGPHPRWSCQLAFPSDGFREIVPWLMLNRSGLTVFVHPETGDHLADHRDHAIWMGEMPALDLSIFDKSG